jgi:hypothetical protein
MDAASVMVVALATDAAGTATVAEAMDMVDVPATAVLALVTVADDPVMVAHGLAIVAGVPVAVPLTLEASAAAVTQWAVAATWVAAAAMAVVAVTGKLSAQ